MKLLIAFLLCCSPLFAQDAKVVAIAPADASKAKDLYDAKVAADKAWDAYQQETFGKYLTVAYGDADQGYEFHPVGNSLTINTGNFASTGNGITLTPCNEDCDRKAAEAEEIHRKEARYERSGWHDGFDWSKDFLFIVPKPEPAPKYNGLTVAY